MNRWVRKMPGVGEDNAGLGISAIGIKFTAISTCEGEVPGGGSCFGALVTEVF